MLVYEDGESVLELYRGEDAKDYLDLRSVTKSVVSTLVGIAIDEGLITGVDATLGELLPAYRDVMNAEVAAIPLDRILTHTAGFAGGRTNWTSTSPRRTAVGAIIADRVARGTGDGSFEYSSAGSHLLAAILDEATGGTRPGLRACEAVRPARDRLRTRVGQGGPGHARAARRPCRRVPRSGLRLADRPAGHPCGLGVHEAATGGPRETGTALPQRRRMGGSLSRLLRLGAGGHHNACRHLLDAERLRISVVDGHSGRRVDVPRRRVWRQRGCGRPRPEPRRCRRLRLRPGIDPVDNAQRFDDGEAINLVQYVILAQPD